MTAWRWPAWRLGAGLIVAMWLGVNVRGVTAQSAPPDYSRACSSSGCHDGYARLPVVHQPVSVGECDACHEARDSEEHAFDLTVSAAELCLECHEDLVEDFDHLHGPLATGACTACHDAHASQHPGLLTAIGPALCLECHEDFEESVLERAHLHQPLADGCGSCHDPHGGAERMSLRLPPGELCVDCHEDVADAVADARFAHAPMQATAGCSACHDPHASAVPGLLTRPSAELCRSCHGPGGSSSPTPGSSLDWLAKPDAHLHGPISAGDCSSCHRPHGGERARLLSGSYPPRLYAGFSEEAYGLCFECHEVEAFEEARTRDLTAFRDGDRNLHHIHVNRESKGRSCRACHEPHAAGNAGLVAESVPFGAWRIPLNFTATATGGSCLPGCHKPFRYDRTKGLETPPSTGPQHSQNEE